jgi:hypothetical protein
MVRPVALDDPTIGQDVMSDQGFLEAGAGSEEQGIG